MPPPLWSDAERSFVRDGIRDDCRIDGRKRHHVRRHTVRTNVYDLSHGSAAIDDRISASVKAELATHAEIIIEQDKRRLSFLEDCLLRYLDLTIVEHQVYWKLSVDVEQHTNESNSLEQTAQCIRFALLHTVLPVVNVVESDANNTTRSMLDRIQLVPDETRTVVQRHRLPQFITIYQIDRYQFLDADACEREIAQATHIWWDDGTIVACCGNPNVASMAEQAVASVQEHYQVESSTKLLIQ